MPENLYSQLHNFTKLQQSPSKVCSQPRLQPFLQWPLLNHLIILSLSFINTYPPVLRPLLQPPPPGQEPQQAALPPLRLWPPRPLRPQHAPLRRPGDSSGQYKTDRVMNETETSDNWTLGQVTEPWL